MEIRKRRTRRAIRDRKYKRRSFLGCYLHIRGLFYHIFRTYAAGNKKAPELTEAFKNYCGRPASPERKTVQGGREAGWLGGGVSSFGILFGRITKDVFEKAMQIHLFIS